MAKFIGTVGITGPISPKDTADTYATHMAFYGQGGYRTVDLLATRDLITPERRELGMIVYVLEDKKEYRLELGIENTNWVEKTGGGGGGSVDKLNYYLVTNMLELESFPSAGILAKYPGAIREVGTTCYVQDTGQEYRLYNGITNEDWKLISDPVLISGGGSSSSEIINNNSYYNKIGCLNTSLIIEALLSSDNGDGTYHNPNDPDNPVISGSNTNIFDFQINGSLFWTSDKVYFSGSSEIIENVDTKIYLEYTSGSNTDTIELLGNIGTIQTLSGNNTIEINGNKSKWNGYLTFKNPGQINLKIYQTKDGVKAYNLNKTIYAFNPNFTIMDGNSNVPLDIIEQGVKFLTKDYDFNVLGNTVLNVSLVKVNVTSNGIDTTNYNIIQSTMKMINTSKTYSIDFSVIDRNSFIDSTYALLVTGVDNGNTIPKYFYGPFIIKLNESL